MRDLWFVNRARRERARLRLFCFPYAGGGASVFARWPQLLPAEVEVWAAQLPGREARYGEPPLADVDALVAGLAPAVRDRIDGAPFVFFGHSLGATLAFETARHLQRSDRVCPARLVVSGRRAPSRAARENAIHTLPDDEFLAELKGLNQTPAAALDHPELMATLLPYLRADFSASHNYRYRAGALLDCPISAFGGSRDRFVSVEDLCAWRRECRSDFSHQLFSGDHFFIHSAEVEVVEAMRQLLDRELDLGRFLYDPQRLGVAAH